MTWPKVKLGDLIVANYGKALKSENRDDSGEHDVFGSNGYVGKHSSTLISQPTIIIGRKGSVGAITYAPVGGWTIDTAYYVTQKKESDFRFLFYALKNAELESLAITTSIPGLNRDSLYRVEIPLPPIAEQKRLAAILDRADELRRVRRQSLRVLDELAQSLFLELFGDPATNPKGWEVVRLGEAVKSLNGRRIPVESSIRATKEKVYRYYGASGIIDQIDDFIFDEETLLIGEDGANLLSRNSPIAFIVSGKYWVNNHAHVLKMKDQIEISYLCFLMNAIDLKPYVTGSAQPKLNAANLMNIEIPLPPFSLQQQFAQQIEELEAIKMRTRASLLELDALFACLQSRAFAGELSAIEA